MLEILSIDWRFDPVAFSLFGVEVRYYGLMWALMILAGSKMFDNFCRREGLPQSVSESIFIYGTLATILGSRIGHCIFYEPEYYLPRPWAILTEIRNGGMASHGAAIGLLIGLYLFSRRNKLPYVWSLDRIMMVVGFGGGLVRVGNLLNSEIFGHPTDMPWGFKFYDSTLWQNVAAPMACHPTQIYEAICYFTTFAIMAVMYYKYDMGRKRPGAMFGVALIGVFFTRFFIEFLKFDQVEFEQGMMLDMGQWLSIPFVILGIYMIYRSFSRPEQMPAAPRVKTETKQQRRK